MIVTNTTPIGRTETESLEFKGRDSRPLDIAREVVALLNAHGGEVWWGIREESGRASAEEPFEDAQTRKRDLQNHLIDTLEPSPQMPSEVDIGLVPTVAGAHVICVKVSSPGQRRRPFAQLREQGRRYWIRVGDRVRIMTREEIAEAFSAGANRANVEKVVSDSRKAVQERRQPCFWMRLQPHPELRKEVPLGSPDLRAMLMDPAATGNRRLGWNFVKELTEPKLGARGLRHAYEAGDEHTLVGRDGTIEFQTPLERLHWQGSERELGPYALMELPVSLLRLGAAFFGKFGDGVSDVYVDFLFVGLHGWKLREGSPRSPASPLHTTSTFEETDDLAPVRPFRFSRAELIAEPDWCAFRILTFVYEAFGFGEDAIPPEFDRTSRRLDIPRG